MPKVTYNLSCNAKDVQIIGDEAIITFEREVDIEDINDAEASGEYQGNMLWECFEHHFSARYSDNVLVTYNDEGSRI